jgi:hypothetical protein
MLILSEISRLMSVGAANDFSIKDLGECLYLRYCVRAVRRPVTKEKRIRTLL